MYHRELEDNRMSFQRYRDTIVKTLWFLLSMQFFASTAFAVPLHAFVSSQDLTRSVSSSNIVLHNNSTTTATPVYGLYIRELSSVPAGSRTCDGSSHIYPDVVHNLPPNRNAGAFVDQIIINPGKSAVVGSNYLYNMLWTSFYYLRTYYGSGPPGCALPGCTWGTDSSIYNWCIKLGALSPVNITSDYANANIPPAGELASDTGYDYNLITDYIVLGPISCDDRTLTCTVATKQTQSF